MLIGLPPRLLPTRLPGNLPTPNVLTAAPQLIRKEGSGSVTKGATIEAKAQIRYMLRTKNENLIHISDLYINGYI